MEGMLFSNPWSVVILLLSLHYPLSNKQSVWWHTGAKWLASVAVLPNLAPDVNVTIVSRWVSWGRTIHGMTFHSHTCEKNLDCILLHPWTARYFSAM